MSWQVLAEYEQLSKSIPNTDPCYGQKIYNVLKTLHAAKNLNTDQLLQLFSAIITRNKLHNKEISNDVLTKVLASSVPQTAADSINLQEIYYECITLGPTKRVLQYIEGNSAHKNYHYQLCRKCNPSIKNTSPSSPAPEVSRKALKALFCLYSIMFQSKNAHFMYVNTEKSFLPPEGSNVKCNISDISPNVIFQKVKNIMTTKFGYFEVENNPSLFQHEHYGLALVSRWEILFYSKYTDTIKTLITSHFLWTCSFNHINFMGYQMDMNEHMLNVSLGHYIETKLSKTITSVGLNHIKTPATHPVDEYFEFLENPIQSDLSQFKREIYDEEIEDRGLRPLDDFQITQRDVEKCGQMIGVLNYIAWNCRWDLQYYASVLNRYARYPNIVVFVNLMNVLRYIYSTKGFSTMYQPSPKRDWGDKWVHIEIHSDGHYNFENPNCSYSGYIINIGSRYWHSKSKRIVNRVNNEYESAIAGAYDAVEFFVLNQSILETLEDFSGKRFFHALYVENDYLYEELAGEYRHELTGIWRERLYTLKGWINEFDISVGSLYENESPSTLLTRDSPCTRNDILKDTYYLDYINHG